MPGTTGNNSYVMGIVEVQGAYIIFIVLSRDNSGAWRKYKAINIVHLVKFKVKILHK